MAGRIPHAVRIIDLDDLRAGRQASQYQTRRTA